ncbi:MAG TPA: hypothetical protein VJH04_01075 [archaeon]|nr:hypothetical protein [archaeon]
MEYQVNTKERPYKSSGICALPRSYQNIITGREDLLEIEKVRKEIKQEGRAIPFIRLFCKSNGKCGV